MKRGDWKCASCGFGNFANRDSCKNCSLSKNYTNQLNGNNNNNNVNNNVNNNNTEVKKGDWSCGSCGFNNFASRDTCKNCNVSRKIVPNQQNFGLSNNNNINNNTGNNTEVKKGDWNCGSCDFSNFASRDTCKNCNLSKEFGIFSNRQALNDVNINNTVPNNNNVNNIPNNTEVKKGDWSCGSCGFNNFASRDSCKNCNASKNVVSNQQTFGLNNNKNNHQPNHSNVTYFEDLNNENLNNFYVRHFCEKTRAKEIFSEQLVSSYHSLSSLKVFPKTSLALERVYNTVKSDSNSFNDCRKVAEACLEDLYSFLYNTHLNGMLFDKIDTFKSTINQSNAPETSTLHTILSHVNFIRHLGNKDSHFQVSTPNVMDSIIAISVTLQMCYSMVVVHHMKTRENKN